MISVVRDYILLIRLNHWMKNCLVIAPSFFSGTLFDSTDNFVTVVLAFFSFSFISSTGYIFNDIVDSESDRKHFVKKNRPIANRRIKPATAAIVAVLLLCLGMFTGLKINLPFVLILNLYLVIVLSYTSFLKDLVIIELLCVSSGFLFRILAGGVGSGTSVSGWLILLTFFLSLLLVFGKRKTELKLLDEGLNFRKVLNNYNDSFLNSGVIVFSAASLITYSFYLMDKGLDWIVFTMPFVCFGVLRYLYLVNVKSKGDPTDVLLKDNWMLACVVLWVIVTTFLIYFDGVQL